MIEGTRQPLYPAIEFADGSWYREESREMARTITEGRLRLMKRVAAPREGDARRDELESADQE
jgi:hypothetical protein